MTDKTDDLDIGTLIAIAHGNRPDSPPHQFILADSLRIGDMVLFKDAVRGLYLGVEGILLEDLVATDGFNLQDSMFCVHLARQYSASRDLNAFLELYDMDIKSIEDEGAKKYLIALQVCLYVICTNFMDLIFLPTFFSAVWRMRRSSTITT